ncbi:MAG: hypothetical protein ACRD3N_12650 [Terracidiphilus sp.]
MSIDDPMELDSNHAAFFFAVCADRFYTAMVPFAVSDPDADSAPSLGGQLLYAGELDQEGRALLVAANVLGAATLTGSSDPAEQKRAVRDGVADFLVNTLDEALRILKNQLRKREGVSVCVAARTDAIEREMEERGVQPDLVAYGLSGLARFPACFEGSARHVELADAPTERSVISWAAETSASIWLPKLDAIVLECLPAESWPGEWAARRWLRLAPRYFGRLAEDRRIVSLGAEAAQKIFECVQGAVKSGEIGVPIWVSMSSGAGTQSARATPPSAPLPTIV